MKVLKLVFAASLLMAAMPLSAQIGNFRIDTARTVIRDNHGNVVGEGIEIHMGGSFESRHDRLKSQKVAYFSNNIDLTSREAEKFWPVYNEYNNQREAISQERNKVLRQLSGVENMENEKEVKALLDSYTACFTKEAELLRKYYQKFSEILPPKKVVRLYITEEQFKQMLLRSIRYQ
jgi:Spy/CpxP family protein refolding chaperone